MEMCVKVVSENALCKKTSLAPSAGKEALFFDMSSFFMSLYVPLCSFYNFWTCVQSLDPNIMLLT